VDMSACIPTYQMSFDRYLHRADAEPALPADVPLKGKLTAPHRKCSP